MRVNSPFLHRTGVWRLFLSTTSTNACASMSPLQETLMGISNESSFKKRVPVVIREVRSCVVSWPLLKRSQV